LTPSRSDPDNIEGVELLVEQDAAPSRGDGLDSIQRRHIVSLPHVLRQWTAILLHRSECTAGEMRLHKEHNKGLHTKLTFKCSMCGRTAELDTDPAGDSLNTALAWGGLSIGVGFSQVQELFAVLNVAAPGARYYRKCERQVGSVSPG
jgi:hypothetical protein